MYLTCAAGHISVTLQIGHKAFHYCCFFLILDENITKIIATIRL